MILTQTHGHTELHGKAMAIGKIADLPKNHHLSYYMNDFYQTFIEMMVVSPAAKMS